MPDKQDGGKCFEGFVLLTPQDRFDYAVKCVLEHEGGYTNDPKDPGGATDYGISLQFLKDMDIDYNHDGLIDVKDIKELNRSDAVNIYKKYYWDKYNYDAIHCFSVAAKLFDMAVNMGPTEAHKLIQRACGYVGYPDLKIDGILGLHTFAALNEISLHNRTSELKPELIEENIWFYHLLVEKNPELDKFLSGWLNRASWWPDAVN